jgi:RNA polymerase sigma factor (sigma-70 family)
MGESAAANQRAGQELEQPLMRPTPQWTEGRERASVIHFVAPHLDPSLVSAAGLKGAHGDAELIGQHSRQSFSHEVILANLFPKDGTSSRSRNKRKSSLDFGVFRHPSVVNFGEGSPQPANAAGLFATTHWSVVVNAADSRSPEAFSAMERLCQSYWYPLYVFVRRKGYSHEDASDLTQAFFAKFLEKHYLHSVDAKLGKFRTFLLTSITNFLANEWDKSQTQRRGGGQQILSLDETNAEQRYELEPMDRVTPETLFERRWAQAVMGLVLDRLAAEMEESRFEILKGFLLEDKGAVSYEAASRELGISVAAVTSAIHRMRGRFRLLLFEEVANTVATKADVEGELRHLLAALSE